MCQADAQSLAVVARVWPRVVTLELDLEHAHEGLLAGLHTCTALTSLKFVLHPALSDNAGPDFPFPNMYGSGGVAWGMNRVAFWFSDDFKHLPALPCLEKLTFAGPMFPSEPFKRSLLDRLPRLTTVSLEDNSQKPFDLYDFTCSHDSDSRSSDWSR